MGRSVLIERYLLTFNRAPYTRAEIPPAGAPSGFDSAAMVGFSVRCCTVVPLRSERHCGCAVLRDITYSLQCYFNGTILYHPRNKYPACHSERSGTDIQNQAIKIRTAAESNPAGAPAGGISALTYGFVQSLISNIQQKRSDPCVVPPYSNVTFPTTSIR